MLEHIIQSIIYEYTYWQIFLLVWSYFLFLYFGLAPTFLIICQKLAKIGLTEKIVKEKVKPNQIFIEIKNSLGSILIFGLSALPLIFLIRANYILLRENTISNVFLGLVLLNIWNELHFFVVHRLMHLPFFMKNVHIVHHQSKVPTIYAVFSFHWFEAFLLSTLPLTICPFLPFASLAILLYPSTSILLNYAGHCNYRFVKSPLSWAKLGTRHNEHHHKKRQNFGFASSLLDKIYSFLFRKKV